ncbi:MAG: flagellar filament capping protein FliD, partial [Bdellovibrionales bacterium]|nr:flagellar filament capping protein FliD [Bdellovibrionales bacterium]
MVSVVSQSHLGTSSFLASLLAAERQKFTSPLSRSISKIRKTADTLSKLSELVKELQHASKSFQGLSGSNLSLTLNSSNSAVVSGSATGQAQKGSYTVDVSQLAENAALSFDDRFNSASSLIYAGLNNTAPLADRTLTVIVGQGTSAESVNLVLTNQTSVADLIGAFNEQSDQANASAVNLGTETLPRYGIVIASKQTGVAQGTLSVHVGNAITDGGSGVFASYTLDQAQDAQFTLSGITGLVARPSNSVTSVIEGATLELKGLGQAEISIAANVKDTTERVTSLIDAYNHIVSFLDEKHETMQSTTLDEQLALQLQGALQKANKLAEGGLGIETTREGTLEFDQETF